MSGEDHDRAGIFGNASDDNPNASLSIGLLQSLDDAVFREDRKPRGQRGPAGQRRLDIQAGYSGSRLRETVTHCVERLRPGRTHHKHAGAI